MTDDYGDGTLSLQLVVPKELGGPGGDGANPEKLFALGYSACFLGAMRVAAQQTKIKVPDGSTVTAGSSPISISAPESRTNPSGS